MFKNRREYRRAVQELEYLRQSLDSHVQQGPDPYTDSTGEQWRSETWRKEAEIFRLSSHIEYFDAHPIECRAAAIAESLKLDWMAYWSLFAMLSLILEAYVHLSVPVQRFLAVDAVLCGLTIIAADYLQSRKYWTPLSAVIPGAIALYGLVMYMNLHL